MEKPGAVSQMPVTLTSEEEALAPWIHNILEGASHSCHWHILKTETLDVKTDHWSKAELHLPVKTSAQAPPSPSVFPGSALYLRGPGGPARYSALTYDIPDAIFLLRAQGGAGGGCAPPGSGVLPQRVCADCGGGRWGQVCALQKCVLRSHWQRSWGGRWLGRPGGHGGGWCLRGSCKVCLPQGLWKQGWQWC